MTKLFQWTTTLRADTADRIQRTILRQHIVRGSKFGLVTFEKKKLDFFMNTQGMRTSFKE